MAVTRRCRLGLGGGVDRVIVGGRGRAGDGDRGSHRCLSRLATGQGIQRVVKQAQRAADSRELGQQRSLRDRLM
jgi:hypothetical protein